MLATTLPQEQWSAPEVVKLYRARWQIELVFKRLKQGLQLHLLPMKRMANEQRCMCICASSSLVCKNKKHRCFPPN